MADTSDLLPDIPKADPDRLEDWEAWADPIIDEPEESVGIEEWAAALTAAAVADDGSRSGMSSATMPDWMTEEDEE